MPDAAYYRAWRKAHPEYRQRETARRREKRKLFGREDRTKEYANRNATRKAVPYEPLAPLYPELRRGKVVSFWEDELRMDLEQERVLALLEGRDPAKAVEEYKKRELAHKKLSLQFYG